MERDFKFGLVIVASVFTGQALAQEAAIRKTADAIMAGGTSSTKSRMFPNNYSIYGLNMRDYTAVVSGFGEGVYLTCDSGEIAVGGFCEEKVSAGGRPNALLSSGVATTRSVACRWSNAGQYRVVASCLAINALQGDVKFGPYSQNSALD